MKKRTIDNFDWRLQAITTISEDCISPYGTPLKKDEPIILVHPVKISDKDTVIPTPNPTAMFLNISNRLYLDAKRKFNFYSLTNSKETKEKKCFDSLERYMASIIFAYTSLESFANESIPDSYVYKKKVKDKLKTFKKKKIEKEFSLVNKLKIILPDIKNINFNEKNPLWIDFQLLKNIRHRIIHMKTIDLIYNRKDNFFEHIWNEIINNGTSINFALKAKDIISLFTINEIPRWLEIINF